MNREELRARQRELMSEERERRVLAWWWLSFADDDGFKGAALIKAWGPATAHYAVKVVAPELTGQVKIVELEGCADHVHANAWLRLQPSIMLTREECEAFDAGFEANMIAMGYTKEGMN